MQGIFLEALNVIFFFDFNPYDNPINRFLLLLFQEKLG